MSNKNRFLTALAVFLLIGVMALCFAACDKTPAATETTPDTAAPTEPSENDGVTEAPTAEPTEEPTEEPTQSLKDEIGLDVKDEDLKDVMQYLFAGTESRKETVMFLEKGDAKSLLFPIESVISVTSYDGSQVYEEGKDYVIEDGKLKVTADSAIPCITAAKYYDVEPVAGISIMTKNPATNQMSSTFWGESQMKQWQVSVTYTHAESWEGFTQDSELDVYQNFVKKLVAGEDVTVFFYGDSITWGACSSFMEGASPNQGSYAILFVEALADLFDYTVKYVNTGLQASMPCAPVPAADYVAGERGTITYVNTAIGGWTSADGVSNFKKFVEEPAATYGCDLFILAYGMNDGGYTASATMNNMKKMAEAVYKLNPEAAVMLVSSMSPHNGSNWDHASIGEQEDQLLVLARRLRRDDKACAVVRVNSVSKAILEHKTFNDYSGNNINHPNDWFYRVYATTLLQTLIGYENMD